ncbi:Uncharacterised protein [Pseudomonas putida]|uniref:Transposase n=1 Tax=Pseudomonas putida NBRC 14164 TaxID=1211579 RepID=A0ABN5URX7_PSEPU|nr:hypothetical protein PP4_47610 [Pseudomonas putida NBRC 14164]SUD74065.1 Uncharacterised protein [Pseudomonas putida]
MTRARLKLSQEGCLWEIALAYFGPEKLLETVVDLWAVRALPQGQPSSTCRLTRYPQMS